MAELILFDPFVFSFNRSNKRAPNGEFMYRFVASIGACHSVSHDSLIPP
jgi:hypothetical protein